MSTIRDTSSTLKETYNPYTDQSHDGLYEHQVVKSPKISKRALKCFQLVLICQKLLKPFNSPGDSVEPGLRKPTKSKSTQEISHLNRIDGGTLVNAESIPCLSHAMSKDDDNTSLGSEEFPYDMNESVTAPYWDLDIDSAIVGDYNSMSALSLNEQIDPHYTTIKVADDGRFVERQQFPQEPMSYRTNYSNEKTNCTHSNTSSPKSGIYSKIMKPKRMDDFNALVNDYYRLHTGERLNFENIMAIRNQLGLSHHPMDSFRSSKRKIVHNATPDIPKRNYDSSVINYIAKLRQHSSNQSANHSSAVPGLGRYNNSEKELSSNNVYSSIWETDRCHRTRISNVCKTPTSEPMVPKRSINRIIRQLNTTHLDDSSEERSSVSFHSRTNVNYSYPRNFSDNYSNQTNKRNQVNGLREEIIRFRHMDSDVDVNVSSSHKGHLIPKGINAPITEDNEHWRLRSHDVSTIFDENILLQPLMERSCEEDYLRGDILASLDCIDL